MQDISNQSQKITIHVCFLVFITLTFHRHFPVCIPCQPFFRHMNLSMLPLLNASPWTSLTILRNSRLWNNQTLNQNLLSTVRYMEYESYSTLLFRFLPCLEFIMIYTYVDLTVWCVKHTAYCTVYSILKGCDMGFVAYLDAFM